MILPGNFRGAIALLVALVFVPLAMSKGLPQDHEYQKQLRAYLASLKEDDFKVPNLKPLEMPKDIPGDLAYRAWVLTSGGGYGSPRFAELRAPASQFTLAWIEGDNSVLRPPITPCCTSWLTVWDYPFNPYRGNKALKRRAFVASVVDMIMHDHLHE